MIHAWCEERTIQAFIFDFSPIYLMSCMNLGTKMRILHVMHESWQVTHDTWKMTIYICLRGLITLQPHHYPKIPVGEQYTANSVEQKNSSPPIFKCETQQWVQHTELGSWHKFVMASQQNYAGGIHNLHFCSDLPSALQRLNGCCNKQPADKTFLGFLTAVMNMIDELQKHWCRMLPLLYFWFWHGFLSSISM
jgi:hypothetical protein